ncbi:metallophosphoesterase [bacterium]|nr:metallophosphoesterase [candidate division CSSED10-310 bacterium]
MNTNRIRLILLIGSWIFFSVVPVSRISGTECVWSDIDRIVAVGDVHGDYQRFVRVLTAAELIDQTLRWTGGATHLVQTGDVPDRGPDSKRVMDLLMDLEIQACGSGGMVHALIGNHEVMNMTGDLRYTTPEEIASHGGDAGFEKAFRPDGRYGSWIAGHNAVIKINDILFLHGGISPETASISIRTINEVIRSELARLDPSRMSFACSRSGPLWYRGLCLDHELDLRGHVEKVLRNFGIRTIVVGHTVSDSGIRCRFEGRVIMIDVGLSAVYGGPAECLVIENGSFQVVSPGKTRTLVCPFLVRRPLMQPVMH